MTRQRAGRLPQSVAAGLACISRRPSEVKDPPTLLFSTTSDPSVRGKTECVRRWRQRRNVEMSSVLPASPVLSRRLFIHQPRLYMWPWHREVVKKKKKKGLSVTYCPALLAPPASAYACTPSPRWKLSILRRRVSIKVTMVICTLGDTGWRFGSAPLDGGGWTPIRGLTFSGRLSNGVVSRGQEPRALGLLPRESGESYERGGKSRSAGRAEVIVLVWRCLKKIVSHVDKFVGFFFFFFFFPSRGRSYPTSHPIIKLRLDVTCGSRARKTRWRGR